MARSALTVEQRFWAKVNKTNTCWLWTGAISEWGHGLFNFLGKSTRAHRASWIFQYGEILPGIFVCHKCSNRHCVRTSHLYLGTPGDNTRDGNRRPRGTGRLTNYQQPILDLETRFWSKVEKTDTCWLWHGSIGWVGYGRFNHQRQFYQAHRLAWTMANGPIPKGLWVLHHCDTKLCVRNDGEQSHLYVGTVQDNVRDAMTRGRLATGLRNGAYTHPERRPSGKMPPECRPRGLRNGSYTHPEQRPRGERNGLAKLTEAQVREMRTLYATGEWTHKALGERYGVSESCAFHIVRGQTWKHLLP